MRHNTSDNFLSGIKDGPLFISAPMVRYSKLAFRKLVRQYNVDIAFTPMIIASSFIQSEKCRDVEFSTDDDDHPLIVQFAANNPIDFANAAELVLGKAEGIDLNCGCPQRWAMKEQYGSYLISQPETLCDIIRQTRARVPPTDMTISIKIRIHDDIKETVEMVRRAEMAGVDFVTVHARTPQERRQPVHEEAFAQIRSSVRIPVFANGDITTLEEAESLVERTGVDGIMSARGILHNPTLFSGAIQTTKECVESWINISTRCDNTDKLNFHRHLAFMLDKTLPKQQRIEFNELKTFSSIIEFLQCHVLHDE